MAYVGAAVSERFVFSSGPDGSAIFARRNQAHPIVAASGALVGLSFQMVLLKLPGWLTPENYPARPSTCRFRPIPFVFYPEKCVGDQE
jgi:hypothetical protein